ncbi:MAG: ABC transporter ATP-binding protein [Blautia sp.]
MEENRRIELKNLRKDPVLEDVSLILEPAHVYLIMGASGSGKTTLLNLMAGLLKPDGGDYLWNGKKFAEYYPESATFRREMVGYVFQNADLLSEYSVRDNILSSISFFKKRFPDKKEWERKAEILGESLDIHQIFSRNPCKISGGEQQRTAIARALLKEPYLLLCDEPTSALDYRMKEKVMDLIRQKTKENRGITMVATHDWELLRYADSAFYLTKGRISEITYEKEGENSLKFSSDLLHCSFWNRECYSEGN